MRVRVRVRVWARVWIRVVRGSRLLLSGVRHDVDVEEVGQVLGDTRLTAVLEVVWYIICVACAWYVCAWYVYAWYVHAAVLAQAATR